jgi:uncharacterized membrane protein YraQ (UPF0718 family)
MQKGIPPAAAIAFLIATPELGVDSVVISVPLLGVELTLARVLAALSVAVITGIVAGLIVGKEPAAPVPDGSKSSLGEVEEGSPLRRATRYGFVDSVDDLGPWMVAGIVLAGMLTPVIQEDWISSLPAFTDVPLLAALAAPLYVCASAATPVGAVFLVKGVAAGAVVAFLLTGPATNVTTYGAIRTAHGKRTTVLVLITILAASVTAGYIINWAGPSTISPALSGEHHEPGVIGKLASGTFLLLLLLSFLRQGPRGFLGRLGLAHEHEEPGAHDGHDHGDDHGHDHDPDEPEPAPAEGCC